jgi:putative hydrolase of HD superfamily
MNAWLDYEHGRTAEGRWMKAMDKFECLLQTNEYDESTNFEKKFDEFYEGLPAKVDCPDGIAWLKVLQKQRDDRIANLARWLPIVFITGSPPLQNIYDRY